MKLSVAQPWSRRPVPPTFAFPSHMTLFVQSLPSFHYSCWSHGSDTHVAMELESSYETQPGAAMEVGDLSYYCPLSINKDQFMMVNIVLAFT